jgi:hypothetical protein
MARLIGDVEHAVGDDRTLPVITADFRRIDQS